MMALISIVIPAYNKEKSIAEMIEHVLCAKGDHAQVGAIDIELLFFDDDPRDKTAKMTGTIAEQISGVAAHQPPNK